MTLPLPLRNRLADLIVEALHDPRARRGLEAVAAVCEDPRALDAGAGLPEAFPADLFERQAAGLSVKRGFQAYRAEFCERARRGWQVVCQRRLDPPDAPLTIAMASAAALFDARLYLEAHEHLEPFWMRAQGSDREALQGLIQAAVGFQHLANGNAAGARSLLSDACARLSGHALAGIELDPFALGVRRCLDALVELGPAAASGFDWTAVPRFPGRSMCDPREPLLPESPLTS